MNNDVLNISNLGLSLTDIEQSINSIPMTKDNAIKLLTISKVLSSRSEEAKTYLLSRCSDCDVYQSGQLQIQKILGQHTTVTNDLIDNLRLQIKEEQDRIKNDNNLGSITVTPYASFKIKR